MSGQGAPVAHQGSRPDGTGLRVGVISTSWHADLVGALLDGARRALAEAGVTSVTEVVVPGSFELPVAAARLAGTGTFDALVALGVVLRGDTPHFDYVCQAATWGLTQVSTSTSVPVGFGVLTCDTYQQALDRVGLPGSAEDKGAEAATAAVATATALRRVIDGVIGAPAEEALAWAP
jgi:6,7-dimethyl-8-ribityllumazine synthase